MTTELTSFGSDCNVAVIGASGGIGGALTRQLAGSTAVSRVYALSRSPLQDVPEKVVAVDIDIEDAGSVAAAAERIRADGELDLVIVATGILHDGEPLQPERRISELHIDNFERVMRINSFGPVLVAQHFLPLLRRRQRTVFAAISARVGSISDNRLGGWASYRASKAALNMLLKTAAIEHVRTRPASIIATLHPGTVATELSAPFSSRVPEGQLFSPDQSASYLLAVIDELGRDDNGGFFAWDGQPIPY